ncbi:hypothetical protein BD626DRAFT_479299 [Schizophyllum amplum]|uniref:Uncharacterized protein n=1 Tax=Schizophyllum amplum TaxID=97359 RepID=A0A550CS41_9AGAR|nr:hypothetical protein BD626DRAFT_479299 [Auriculariopsis ampla]
MAGRGVGRRQNPTGLAHAAGSMSFNGQSPTRQRVLEIGFNVMAGFPQFTATTAHIWSYRRQRVACIFHPNQAQVQANGVVRQIVNYGLTYAAPPHAAQFRIDEMDNQGNWIPLLPSPAFPWAYILKHRKRHRIVINGIEWELWLVQTQQSRQAFGPGPHNLP